MPLSHNTDEELIEELRRLYAQVPGTGKVTVHTVERGARRRRVRRRAGIAGLSAAVACATVVAAPFGVPSGFRGPDATPSDYAAEPTAVTGGSMTPTSGDANNSVSAQATDEVYAVLDADPGLGYYMLSANAEDSGITIWGTPSPATLDAARQAAGAGGMTLSLKPLPEDMDPFQLQRTFDQASVQLRAEAEAPGYGFCFLKLELPLRTVVVWRENPDAQVDSRLRAIATEAGIDLELRTASMSQDRAQGIGAALRGDNHEWEQHGFTVLGAYARPAGAIVSVLGDVGSARTLLGDRPGILAIMDGSIVQTPVRVQEP